MYPIIEIKRDYNRSPHCFRNIHASYWKWANVTRGLSSWLGLGCSTTRRLFTTRLSPGNAQL